jgi:Uma2 family endonuclease
MVVAQQKLTFEEYLVYDDGTDTRYELVNGELVAISQPEGLHEDIAERLYLAFKAEIERLSLPWVSKQGKVGVRSPRAGRWDTSRIPDVTVLLSEQWATLRHREAVIELNESPPLLVVEVVSESTKTVDYRAKRVEYNVLDIPEYVIVDPTESKVTVYQSIDQMYEPSEFYGSEVIQLKTFPQLHMQASQALSPL